MEKTARPAAAIKKRRRHSKAVVRESIELYGLMLPVILVILCFSYFPLFGIVIAFQDYQPGNGFFWGDIQWVGLKHFKEFISSSLFPRLFGNTIRLSLKNLLFGFWVPIAFALLLNELRHLRFKKFVQTASYLPHFISTVVVAGMVLSFLRTDGLINSLYTVFGGTRTAFINEANYFDTIYILTNIWIAFGFDSILYLSAISGIDPQLYESARLDGASRLKQVWYITLPCILPTIAILLIMAVGGMVSSNTDMILLLYNEATYPKSDVIGTYVYRVGLGADGTGGGQYSLGAAINLFSTTINFCLLFLANKISNKLTSYGMF